MTTRALQKLEILKAIRGKGRLSRPDLGSILNLPPPSISALTRELLDANLLVVSGYQPSSAGRRAELLDLNPGYAVAAGLEISLSFGIRALIVDLGGKVIDRESCPSCEPDQLIPMSMQVLSRILDRHRGPLLEGLGVAVSGLVDSRRGVSIEFPRTKSWRNVPLKRMIMEQFPGLRVWVENDVHSATMAVLRYGEGRGLSDLVYLHMGHGIAAGIVVNGELYRGASGNAGEFGHTPVRKDGPICYCGSRGCLESVAGVLAIQDNIRAALEKGVHSVLTPEELSPERVLDAAAKGDRLATRVLIQAAEEIGDAAGGLVNLLNPEAIILGGRLGQAGGVFRASLEDALRARMLPLLHTMTPVRSSTLGPDAAASGAAALIFEKMFSNPDELFARGGLAS